MRLIGAVLCYYASPKAAFTTISIDTRGGVGFFFYGFRTAI
jgi:hypothetical protein